MDDKALFNLLLKIRTEDSKPFQINPNYYLHFGKPTSNILERYKNQPIIFMTVAQIVINTLKNFAGFLFYSLESKKRKKLKKNYDYVFISHITNRNFLEESDPYFDFLIKLIPNTKKILIIYLNGSKYMNQVACKKIANKFSDNVEIFVIPKYGSIAGFVGHIKKSFVAVYKLKNYKSIYKESIEFNLRTNAITANFHRNTFSNLSILEVLNTCLKVQKHCRIFTTFEGNLFESFVIYNSRLKNDNIFFFYQHTPIVISQFGLQSHLADFNQNCILLTTGKLVSDYLTNFLPTGSEFPVVIGSKKVLKKSIAPTHDGKTILFAPEGTREAVEEMWIAASYIARNNRELICTIRIHPSLFRSEFNKLNLKLDLNNLRISQTTLKEDFEANSYCVYRSSAVGIEASLAGLVPVYFSNSYSNLDILEITHVGHFKASNVNELVSILKRNAKLQDNYELANVCSTYFEKLNSKNIQNLL